MAVDYASQYDVFVHDIMKLNFFERFSKEAGDGDGRGVVGRGACGAFGGI